MFICATSRFATSLCCQLHKDTNIFYLFFHLQGNGFFIIKLLIFRNLSLNNIYLGEIYLRSIDIAVRDSNSRFREYKFRIFGESLFTILLLQDHIVGMKNEMTFFPTHLYQLHFHRIILIEK